jgi:hypothetical protein
VQCSGSVTAGAAGLLLAMMAGAQGGPVASDRIIGEEDSPPPFLTGFVPFDITIPETTPETSISILIGTAAEAVIRPLQG